MATFSWPTALYGFILKGSYQESPPDNSERTKMDVGPAKTRRRTTAGVRTFTLDHFFTSANLVIFDEFYNNTIKSGSLEFNYRHPKTQVLGEYRITDLPSYAQMNEGYRVRIKMEMLPV